MLRLATHADLPTLVAFMQAFYAEAGLGLAAEQATPPLATLLADETLGAVWLLETGGQPVGYLALVWCFSLEYGGRRAMLEDFFVLPDHRGKGLGQAALAAVPDLCQAFGARAVSVEVGTDNPGAGRLYRRAGFEPVADRELLTHVLAAPTHYS